MSVEWQWNLYIVPLSVTGVSAVTVELVAGSNCVYSSPAYNQLGTPVYKMTDANQTAQHTSTQTCLMWEMVAMDNVYSQLDGHMTMYKKNTPIFH